MFIDMYHHRKLIIVIYNVRLKILTTRNIALLES